MKTSISFLSSKFSVLETLIKIDNTDADLVHVDIMDGKFTDNKFVEIDCLKQTILSKPLDVHLMTYNITSWIEKFDYLNVSNITFQYEANEDIKQIIKIIKSKKINAGIALNPETDISVLMPYINDIDIILLLGVKPGKGGQEFIESTLDKIKQLKKIKKENHCNFKIEVDGGVNDTNAKDIKKAGCDILVSGSFICKRNNFQEQLDLIK